MADGRFNGAAVDSSVGTCVDGNRVSTQLGTAEGCTEGVSVSVSVGSNEGVLVVILLVGVSEGGSVVAVMRQRNANHSDCMRAIWPAVNSYIQESYV